MAETVLHTEAANQVVKLVKFSYGSTPTVNRYARWDSDVVVGSDTFLATSTDAEGSFNISIDFDEQGGGTDDAGIEIKGPRTLPPFTNLSTGKAHAPVHITIYDATIGSEVATLREIFFGRVQSARRNPSSLEGLVALRCKGIKADLIAGLGMNMTTQCQSWLGHPTMCKINLTPLKETSNAYVANQGGKPLRVLLSFAQTIIFDVRKWREGWLEFDDLRLRIKKAYDGYGEVAWQSSFNYSLNDLVNPAGTPTSLRYRVTTDSGSSGGSAPTWPDTAGQTVVDSGITWTAETVIRFDLSRQPPDTWLSQTIVAVPGCDGQLVTCQRIYSNEGNFCGYGIAIPARNPVFETG